MFQSLVRLRVRHEDLRSIWEVDEIADGLEATFERSDAGVVEEGRYSEKSGAGGGKSGWIVEETKARGAEGVHGKNSLDDAGVERLHSDLWLE